MMGQQWCTPTRTVYVDNDGNNGDGRDGDNDSYGGGDDAAAATDGNNVDDDNGDNSRTLIGRRQSDGNDRTTTMYIDDDGDDGDDRNGGDGDGDGNDAIVSADRDDVDEDNSGDSRTTFGRRRLDDDDWMTTMRWRWAASNMQNACKCCAIHPKRQSTNVESLGRRKQERGGIWGDRYSEKSQGGID